MEAEESLSKKNISFSISLDLDDCSNESCSDSESAGLQIDISEIDNLNSSNRLGKQLSDQNIFTKEFEEEIERQLGAKAAKSNLTATNVKNIIKQVISHEHVREMYHQKLKNNDGSFIFNFEPKFTRSKAKELAIVLPDIPLTLKNTNPEVQALVQEEIIEDSSDEEYDPEQDQNDKDKDNDNFIDENKDIDYSEESDFESQPPTPATPCTSFEMPQTPEVQYDEEGVFKVPQAIPREPTEEESIGHRTRSKLSLEETPMELIEQMGAIVAPDFTSDLCFGDPDPDDEYSTFLNELFYRPQAGEVNDPDPDDPEADPEYVAEEEVDSLNKDEFKKGSKDVEISRKEIETLIADLSDYADVYMNNHYDMITNQQEEQNNQQSQKVSKKKKTPDNSFTIINNISTTYETPVPIESELSYEFTTEQRQLLSVQMSHHVQLAAQQFLMTYKHPKFHEKSKTLKEFFNDLLMMKETSNSASVASNLEDAFKLITDWETKLSDSNFLEEYTEWLRVEIENAITFANSKRRYKIRFHFELIKLMCESKALLHPYLLPELFPDGTRAKKDYLLSEENLIAIGLEQYIPLIKKESKKFKGEQFILIDAVSEVVKNKLPIRDFYSVFNHIKKRKNARKKNVNNPIKYYFMTGSAPKIEHRFLSKYELIPPKKQYNLLSSRWQNYVENLKNGSLKELSSASIQSKKITDVEENLYWNPQFESAIPSIDHELRNPIVNMMRRMSSLIASQKSDSSSKTPKTNKCKSKSVQSKTNEVESDAETSQSLTCELDEEKSRNSRLRMTSPRLAKIKSVQNMRLLAHNVSSKASNSGTSVTENYDKIDDDTSTFDKGDNEDEIAEFMEASINIKKNKINRKKTKQARELENVKKYLEAENNINEDEKSTKFAASFMQKLHDTLESKDPELLKTIMKILTDYSEKLENLSQCDNDYFLNKSVSVSNSSDANNIEEICIDKDKLSINLYKEIYEKLHEYQDLCSDLLLFLTPYQAALINQFVEHTMLEKMNKFVNVFQRYFAKQPSRIEKIMQAITQIAMDPYVTQESAQTTMGTALKGQPLIMDLFLQTLPKAKPPESLFADHMFENLSCPVGPHDKNKAYDEDSPELYENIELPVSTPQEDPYGGDSCKCDCHNCMDDSKSKGLNEHCASCAMKFLNGRIFLQTSEGLRPAKITFPGEDDEKLENISRVSLKMTERVVPSQPPKKRRKTSKRDSISEDSSMKPGLLNKGSPSKGNDENNEKPTTKLKKPVKSPPKTVDKKKLDKTHPISVKSKREKKEKKDLKLEHKTDDEQTYFTPTVDQTEEVSVSNKFGELSTDSHEDDNTTSPEKLNISSTSNEKLISSDSDSSTNLEPEVASKITSWTKKEDKILLEHLQKEYSEKSFQIVSSTLKNRSVEQVKERCEYLLLLIKKMK